MNIYVSVLDDITMRHDSVHEDFPVLVPSLACTDLMTNLHQTLKTFLFLVKYVRKLQFNYLLDVDVKNVRFCLKAVFYGFILSAL